MRDKSLDAEQAEAIYDILVLSANASNTIEARSEFVHHQTNSFCPEFRFMGRLGFGGKFWRNFGFRPDGTWGEVWYVNTYSELMTDEREKVIADTNHELGLLRQRYNV